MALVAGVIVAFVLALGAANAQASLLSPGISFGTTGSGAGQLNTPLGVAIDQSNGDVYVADTANARVDKFDASGHFIAAFGWGVADGKARSEVCGVPAEGVQGAPGAPNCQAGIPGSGPGQFSAPTSVAVGPPPEDQDGNSQGQSTLYVGDAANAVVERFTGGGTFESTIDGTTTPQGHFSTVAGVSVDQGGNLWVADGNTDNITEYTPTGGFVRQWNDTFGSTVAIAVDANHNAVYLIRGARTTERFTLAGGNETVIDNGSGNAIAVDPAIGNLYVDHGGDVATYNPGTGQVDSLTLSTSNSQGLAFRSQTGQLYVSDASANNVTVFNPPTTPGAPIVAGAAATGTGKTTATFSASVVADGLDTSCTFQYVNDADFQASGFTNATSVPCTPPVGSGFAFEFVTANASGLTVGDFYHFRVVAKNSAGTTTGADTLFQAGPGLWTPFNRCPVDDPAMLATTGASSLGGGTGTVAICLASTSSHGSITIGNFTTPTGLTNLQTGQILDNSTFAFTTVAPSGGALLEDSVQLSTPIGPVTAVTTSAGAPSNFNLGNGIGLGQPIITIPIKIQLESPTLGPSCFLGSDQNPIVLNPVNKDLSHASLAIAGFDADGTPDNSGPLASLVVNGAVQGDDTFAVPGATGCGPNGDGSLDAAVNAVAGLPSPSGSNHLELDNTSSSLALPLSLAGTGGLNGQQFAADWHVAFG